MTRIPTAQSGAGPDAGPALLPPHAPGIIRPTDVRPELWANGHGMTRVLYERPAWRLSLAEIEGQVPFSAFPGRDRILLPLDGRLVLNAHGRRRTVHPGEAFAFRGEDPVIAESREQRTVVNVMVARDHARVVVDIRGHAGPLPTERAPDSANTADAAVLLSGSMIVDGAVLQPGSVLLPAHRSHEVECPYALLAWIRVIPDRTA